MFEPKEILKKYWGFDSFRPLQEEIIHAVLNGQEALALLPTGGGKSVCFQVPGLCLDGLTIVVSPLISLMKDQVEQLKAKGIKASAVYSGMSKREIDIILDNCIYGGIQFLYVSPERLKTDLFLSRVTEMKVVLLAVDEAHCISQWGYDFRPSYLEIATIYPLLPDVRKIALTATATPDVSEDICQRLEFENPSVFTKSFARKNLSYSVFKLENKEQKTLEILKNVQGSAVIYVRSRKETVRVARNLARLGVSADYYHAGISAKERALKQSSWIKNQKRVIVATNAFGMGIDKPDVRVVIHLDVPDSIEAYYQEAGRGGRDERSAFAVLLYSEADVDRLRTTFERSFPEPEFIRRVYQALSNYYKLAVGSSQWQSFDFDMNHFVKTYDLNTYDTFYTIKKLEEEGLILLNESFFKQSTVMIPVSTQEIYRYCIANVAIEPFLKGLLRLYGGTLYGEFAKINEYDLAKLVHSSAQEVTKKLEFLHQNGMLIYDKMKDKPQLTFLTPRMDASKLTLDKKKLEDRRKVVGTKIDGIIEYAENTLLCRTTIFQDYFGEQDYINCGVCDVCINARKRKGFEERLDEAQELLKLKASTEWAKFKELQEHTNIRDNTLFAEGVRALIDSGFLEINNKNELKRR